MRLTVTDFCELLGITEPDFPGACRTLLDNHDFEFDVPDARTRDQIILGVLRHLDSDKPTKVGEHRADIWESCWADNLRRFAGAAHDPNKLVPEFIGTGKPVRLRQNYVLPRKAEFEADFLKVCRAYLFDTFFREAGSVYEFGCGSGFNLVALSEQLPGKSLYGLDWSKSSNDTVNLLRTTLGIDITGRRFDFFNPDTTLRLEPGSGVLTMCALEQVGARHERFLQYLISQRPRICVHMEPLVDLYDESDLIDYLAIRYHRKRGYLEDFIPRLRQLAAAGVIEIIDIRRMRFGSLYHEGYSYVAWKPGNS